MLLLLSFFKDSIENLQNIRFFEFPGFFFPSSKMVKSKETNRKEEETRWYSSSIPNCSFRILENRLTGKLRGGGGGDDHAWLH